MKRIFLTVSVTLVALGGVPSEPTPSAAPAAKEPPKLAATTTRVKCSICQGKGTLKVRPPDVGQFTGKINDRSHWDVKLDRTAVHDLRVVRSCAVPQVPGFRDRQVPAVGLQRRLDPDKAAVELQAFFESQTAGREAVPGVQERRQDCLPGVQGNAGRSLQAMLRHGA